MGLEVPISWYKKKPHSKIETTINARTGLAMAMIIRKKIDSIEMNSGWMKDAGPGASWG